MTGQAINPGYLTEGTIIGAYQVVGQVGGGGFGFVYRVRRDGRIYALKIGQERLSALAPDERAETVERLEREIAALASLHHPNIVRVHSFERWPDLEGGFPYLIMDFVDGAPLLEWREGTAAALGRIVAAFEKIADALDHMHQLGIVHRDLKSQNILVRTDGEPFIVDFGIARPRVAYDVTRASGIGTLSHMSPEYVDYLDSAGCRRGEPFDWAPTTDLYALGYVLYEALTGEPPLPLYDGTKPKEEADVLAAIKAVLPKRPREVAPRLPGTLDDLVMQLLEKDPAKRPQRAADVAARLRQAREAGEAVSDAVWIQPFDLPGAAQDGRPAEPQQAGTAQDDDGEDLAAIEDAERSREGTAKPAAAAPQAAAVEPAKGRAPGAARPGPAFSEATTEPSTAYNDDGEAAEAKAEPAASVGWSRESQILKRAATEFEAATQSPRRWLLAVAVAAGSLVLLLVLLVATRGATERPGPKTLLSAVDAGARPAPSPLSAPPVAAPPSPAVQPAAPTSAPAGPDRPLPDSLPRARDGRSKTDAQAIDDEPARRYGRPTVVSDGRLGAQPPAQLNEPSGIVRSRPFGSEPQVLQRSQPVASATPAPPGPKTRGVPFGAHVQARLLTNLDSRTIANGPVEALLHVPYVVRGQVMLPTRTMVYGTASESGGRFTIRFNRLRLPDDTEAAFEGIALARDDGKPGLAASGRIGQEPKRGEALGARIAKGTGNILLDTITGGTSQTIARSAGQAALNHEEPQPASGQWALLLDAGVVFDIFVERAF